MKPCKRVLFVDDEKYVHDYAKRVAQELGLRQRHALSPRQAEKLIARRVNAVKRLLKLKQVQLAKAKSASEKKRLAMQKKQLLELSKRPFDLVVSDAAIPNLLRDADQKRMEQSVRQSFNEALRVLKPGGQARFDRMIRNSPKSFGLEQIVDSILKDLSPRL